MQLFLVSLKVLHKLFQGEIVGARGVSFLEEHLYLLFAGMREK